MATNSQQRFIVNGVAPGHGSVQIGWAEGEGFDDPTGLTGLMIEAGTEVCATVTGPCYAAADRPGVVALLTAKQALSQVDSVEGAEEIERELDALVAVPPDATP